MPTIAEELIQRGREEGEKRGREEGEKKGEKKAKLETARRLLALGMSPDEVASLVELPREEVQALIH